MSGRIRRLRALIRKEILQILRDPSSILIAFILPVVLLFLFGYGVSLDTRDIRIGLVVENPTPSTERLADSFRGSRYFLVREGRDRREFEKELVNGGLRGIVVIPAAFSDNLLGGRNPGIQVLVDGSDPNTAKFVANYTRGAVAAWAAKLETGVAARIPSISVEQRFWFNPELSSRAFLVPGSIAVVMTIVGTLLTSLVIAREWERGTMEAIMATPVTATELLLGKLVPYFLLGLMSMTICVVIAVLLFAIPLRGSLAALYLLASVFLLPALGLGLIISAATKNQFVASQIGLVAGFLPSYLLSGVIFEIGSMPEIIQTLTLAVPARHLVPGILSVFLAGDIWPMFLRDMLVLCGMGAASLLVAGRLVTKRIG